MVEIKDILKVKCLYSEVIYRNKLITREFVIAQRKWNQ